MTGVQFKDTELDPALPAAKEKRRRAGRQPTINHQPTTSFELVLTEPAEKSVDDILADAAKTPKQRQRRAAVSAELQAAATELLPLLRQQDELERRVEFLKESIKEQAKEVYRRQTNREPTLNIATLEGVLRVTFQHRYGKISAADEAFLRRVMGPKYGEFIAGDTSVSIRKDVLADPAKRQGLIKTLYALFGEHFKENFEADVSLAPTKAFTERRYRELSAEANAELDRVVKQTVTVAEGK